MTTATTPERQTRLERFIWAARYLDDLPNRPQRQPGAIQFSPLPALALIACWQARDAVAALLSAMH